MSAVAAARSTPELNQTYFDLQAEGGGEAALRGHLDQQLAMRWSCAQLSPRPSSWLRGACSGPSWGASTACGAGSRPAGPISTAGGRVRRQDLGCWGRRPATATGSCTPPRSRTRCGAAKLKLGFSTVVVFVVAGPVSPCTMISCICTDRASVYFVLCVCVVCACVCLCLRVQRLCLSVLVASTSNNSYFYLYVQILMRLAYRPIEKGTIVLFILLIDTSFAGRFERPRKQE